MTKEEAGDKLERAVDALDKVTKALAQQASHPGAAESDDRLTKVEAAVKWATPWHNLLVLIAFLVVGGISVVVSLQSYAEDAVVETVKDAVSGDKPLIEPSLKTVNKLKMDVYSVKSGVDCLVAGKRHEDQIKAVEVELDLHRQQYAALVQEWSTKSALRRNPGPRPKKSDGHVAIEARWKELMGTRPKCPGLVEGAK